MAVKHIKAVFSLACILTSVMSVPSYADEVNPHEIMFINCTQQAIHATNGGMSPYKFSMDPAYEARNGYSPSYSFDIPTNTIYKHPITIFTNWFHDGAMHIYLSGAVNAEIYITLMDNKYINYKADPRYVSFLGYNNNWVPGHGHRTILGLGCTAAALKGAATHTSQFQNFKVSLVETKA